jgi:hypothetical protein
MADNFDVIVDFSMNEEGNKEVLEGTKSVTQHLREMEQAAKNAGKTVNQVLEEGRKEFGGYATDFTKASDKVEKGFDDQSKAAAKAATAQAQIWNIQARQLNTQGRLLQLQSRDLLKYADAVGIVSRGLLVGGTAVTGGIFKLANDFIKNAPEATELTIKWKEAQDSLAESASRAGKVSAEAALPILEEVAKLASKAATFMEENPGLVRAALNVGIVTAGLGALGILVSKGIKLQADLLYIQSVPLMQEAASLNMAAAEQMLVAAQLNAEAKGIDVVEGGLGPVPTSATGKGALAGLASGIGEVVVLLGSFAVGLIAGDKIFDAIEKRDVKFADYLVEFKQMLAIDAKNFGDLLEKVKIPFTDKNLFQADTGEQMFKDVATSLGLLKSASDDAADSVSKLAGTVEASPAFEKILNAYEKYQTDDLKLVDEHYTKRKSIIAEALKDETAENQKFRSAMDQVRTDTASKLTDLASNYNQDLVKAEQKLASDRAKILQDESADIQKIEEDLQETLRKNELEHNNTVSGLVAKRDALALDKENQRFVQEQSEARRGANIEIRRRRAELGRRLEELEQEYVQERAARYQEYVQRAAEIKTQAAERMQELAVQHQEELQKIREQTSAKLKAEDEQFLAERKRKYDYFLQQIRDLDASLLGERNLRLQYQQSMISDLDAFLVKYRAGLASMADAVPHKAAGDYTSGLVMTGEKGYEWIANHNSTVAAETLIGGRLNQETFMQAMRTLQASRNATYIDQRRLEAPMNRANKEAYVAGAKQALLEILGVKG